MLSVALTLIVIGVLLWLVTTYVPMNGTISRILIGFVVVCVVIWLLQVFGLFHLANVPVPQVR